MDVFMIIENCKKQTQLHKSSDLCSFSRLETKFSTFVVSTLSRTLEQVFPVKMIYKSLSSLQLGQGHDKNLEHKTLKLWSKTLTNQRTTRTIINSTLPTNYTVHMNKATKLLADETLWFNFALARLETPETILQHRLLSEYFEKQKLILRMQIVIG